MTLNMVGRLVRPVMEDRIGQICKWEPLGSAMCDALVEFEDGSRCWYASSNLRPADDFGELDTRHRAYAEATGNALESLYKIADQHASDLKRWPGYDIVKRIIESAIEGVKNGAR